MEADFDRKSPVRLTHRQQTRIGALGRRRATGPEVEEAEVLALVRKHVRVDAERDRGVGVAQLLGDPPDALVRAQGERGPGVARRVQRRGALEQE